MDGFRAKMVVKSRVATVIYLNLVTLAGQVGGWTGGSKVPERPIYSIDGARSQSPLSQSHHGQSCDYFYDLRGFWLPAAGLKLYTCSLNRLGGAMMAPREDVVSQYMPWNRSL